ncbi:MAG: hypothetical protein WCI77_06550 [Candidatus Omnitrophota bacterium]
MTLEEILKACKDLSICEERSMGGEYCELVFLNKEIDRWNKIFNGIFGPAIKPKGSKPTKADLLLTDEHGGISDNQTLFQRDFGKEMIFAMFWPWQDGINVTLKIVLVR